MTAHSNYYKFRVIGRCDCCRKGNAKITHYLQQDLCKKCIAKKKDQLESLSDEYRERLIQTIQLREGASHD